MASDAKSILRKLIETAKDGEKGFAETAEHVKRQDLKTFFQQQSTERGRFARELEAEASRLGYTGERESGSAAGAMHRAWIDVKSSLGAGDRSILASVEQGEDSAKKVYEEALQQELPDSLLNMIRTQYQNVVQAHDRVRWLRDSLAA